MEEQIQSQSKPGVCIPWEKKREELPDIQGDPELLKEIWQEVDELAYTYIWHLLVSF